MRKDRSNRLPLHRVLLPVATALLGLYAAFLLSWAQEPAAGPQAGDRTVPKPGSEEQPVPGSGSEEQSPPGQDTGGMAQVTEDLSEQGQENGEAAETASAQETKREIREADREERVLLVTQTREEADCLAALAQALGKRPVTVSEEEYGEALLEDVSYLITTSRVCEEAAAGGFPSLCLGDACLSAPGLSLERAGNAAVSLQLGEYTQDPFLEQEVSYITNHSGRGLGNIKAGGAQAPFAVKTDHRIDAPFFSTSGLGAVMTGEAMAQLFGGGEPGKMYLVLDEVYPFSDLAKLCRMADLLAENGIPFLVRVMPVYDNLEYPALRRYLQVLRYLQAKDGSIVLHEPVAGAGTGETEPLADKLQRFRRALAENGVYEREFEFPPYMLTWQEIGRIRTATKNFGTFSVDTMFPVPADMPLQEFQELLEQINARWLSLSDYKENFTDETYQYREEPIEEIFIYRQEPQADMTDFFSRADSILLLVVGAGLLIFGVLLAVGSRRYRRKFYQ